MNFIALLAALALKKILLRLQPVYDDFKYFFNPFSYDDLAAAYLCVVLIDIIFIWHLPYSSLRAASLLCLRFAAGTSSVNCLMIAA